VFQVAFQKRSVPSRKGKPEQYFTDLVELAVTLYYFIHVRARDFISWHR
jgi:hypothetical protein